MTVGLDLGWTINMYNKLSHSILSSIGWTMMYLPDKLYKIDNYSLIAN